MNIISISRKFKFAKSGKFLFLRGIILFALGYFKVRRLPPPDEIIEEMYREPVQVKTDKKAFSVEKSDITYLIEPLYSYHIHGLVVSRRDTSVWWNTYHSRWKDHLNIKDVGLVWGRNLKSGMYKKMKFTSGSFTLYTKPKSETTRAEWSNFNQHQISNNHLLSSAREISKKILGTNDGDQIRIKGYLSKYSHDEGFSRGTSTSRKDNSCETIFVKEYEILKRANPKWNFIYRISKLVMAGGLILSAMSFIAEIAGVPRDI
ncbi:MAG: hypothetical protein ACQESB_03805 [Elusimicrobiota bacterium]